MLALLPINLTLAGLPDFTGMAVLATISTVIVAGLVVSRLPTLSGKGRSGPIPRERVIPIVGVVLAISMLLVSHPFLTFTLLTLTYLALLPVGFAKYRGYRNADARLAAGEAK
jgi:CDP-diacylglycerol--serine O-phosphatidyltransferase